MSTGKFVWRELYTKDPRRDQGFFGELFGWKVDEMPMGTMTYPTLSIHDHAFGALLSQDESPEDRVRGWIPYVSAPVDEAASKVEGLGGKVCVPPTDIPGGGRFAILQDFAGAAFGVHEHPNAPPMPDTMPGPGEPCWETLTTSDLKRAEEFYSGVLGWKTVAGPTGKDDELVFALEDGTMVADVQRAHNHEPCWSTYIAVASLEGVLGPAQRMGARVTIPRTEIPNVGSAVFINDPTGCELGLFQPLD